MLKVVIVIVIQEINLVNEKILVLVLLLFENEKQLFFSFDFLEYCFYCLEYLLLKIILLLFKGLVNLVVFC